MELIANELCMNARPSRFIESFLFLFFTLLYSDTLPGDIVEPVGPRKLNGRAKTVTMEMRSGSSPAARCFLVNYTMDIIEDAGPPFAGRDLVSMCFLSNPFARTELRKGESSH